jgi:integrase
MFSPQTPLIDFFRLAYVPDRLAGDAHKTTRAEYEIQIRKVDRHFQEWLAQMNPPQPPRPIALADLSDAVIKFAMAREVEVPRHPGGKCNGPDTANKILSHVKPIWMMAARSESEDGPVLVKRLCFTKHYRTVKREPRAWMPEEVREIVAEALLLPGLVGDVAHPYTDLVCWKHSGSRLYGDVAAADFWLAMLLAHLSMGVRISAHMAIPTSNWDPRRAQVLVPGDEQKNWADQLFDLLPSANDALERLAPRERGLPTLFADWPHDRGGGWRTLRRHHEVLLVRAGLFEKAADVTRYDHFHKYRKTVGTEIAVAEGIEKARQYLGHSSTQVTERYLDKRRLERTQIQNVIADPMAAATQIRLFNDAG